MKRGDLRTVFIALATGLVGVSAPAIAHGVQHAKFAHKADMVDGLHAAKSTAANKNNKLIATDSSGKLPGSIIPIHPHDAADLVSGTLADARIGSSIARDNEILSTVLEGDGPGSTLNADQVDGKDSTDLETVIREENDNPVDQLDIDTSPVWCQTPAYVADAGDRASTAGSASVGTTGTSFSFGMRTMFSTDGGGSWSNVATQVGRETVGQNQWANASVMGATDLTAGQSYIFGLQITRDTQFGATTTDPTIARCHHVVEISEGNSLQ